ncbi:Holliday junction branch migration DNA helicase RuvB [Candidatus Peregrinibacteria bacterium]|jgi:holliday junction DNA helicase RuvB|nr:Holliday junction branch migration DNA helicase RuvB [Candidatus Peregrinibacteria bacterium]
MIEDNPANVSSGEAVADGAEAVDDRLVEGNFKTYDQFENKLRPQNLVEYVGQAGIKANLGISLQASLKRGEPLEHVLLYGPPGLGKTTLAGIIANEMGANLKITSGPALEKQGDIVAILTNLQDGDVLFIDEIHRTKAPIEEVLYSAMEDFCVDIIIGKGPSARSMRIQLPHFTLIGATTKVSMLSNPLHDRFGNIYKLQFYSEEEIATILLRSAKILGAKINEKAAERLACASRRTPRIANRLLRRVRDYAEIYDIAEIDLKSTEKTLDMLGIDILGLDQNDRELLITIAQKFRGGPVGLNTLSAATSEEEGTIEDMYEPFLLQLGFLERTSKGRKITDRALEHLGINLF